MRVAFVVQRYGPEISGGAEMEARLLAERLLPYVQIEVLTTTAKEYMTWENHYAPGLERINGVPVRRFRVAAPRDVARFDRYSADLLGRAPSHYDEVQWMALQGPDTPELFDYIRAHQDEYDLFLFFTYLYATTYIGLQIVPHKSLLFPTAHDEPWIHFGIFRSLFNLPRGFIFNSPEEERLVRRLFHNRHIPGVVLGVGIDTPVPPPIPTLGEPYLLYLGRIDESKGCRELFAYFLRYKAESGDPVKLVLIGGATMPVPRRPDILALGFMQEQRFAWLRDAEVLIMPSPYESLSLVTLEAWALGRPVLLNGQADVLKGQAHRSHGGLVYHSAEEFVEALRLLRTEPKLARRLGEQGRRYVETTYRWSKIVAQYIAFLRSIRATNDR